MVKSNAVEYFQGVGRRKTAIARVRLMAGSGKLLINDNESQNKEFIFAPLVLVDLKDKYNIVAKVNGGGYTSSQEAIRLGAARALIKFDAKLKPTLRKAGFLTRDPRAKERKKPGLKGARRAPQWSKR